MKITSIQNNEGVTLTSDHDIQTEFVDFFQKLLGDAYSDCSGGSTEFFDSLQLPSLSIESHASLVAYVSAKEIFDALKSMPKNKTPGPDVYTVDFFLASWEFVGPLFIEAVQEFFAYWENINAA